MSTAKLSHLAPPRKEIQSNCAPLSNPATDARRFGCVLLRFRFPNGEDFHVALCELGQPRIQHLLALLSKLFGVPVLLPPSDKFASAVSRNPRREEKAQEEEVFAYA